MARIITCSKCNENRPNRGRGLCKACYYKNYERPSHECTRCGETKPHHANNLCKACYESPPRECAGCGGTKPIEGNNLCFTCYKSPPRKCTGCGDTKPINGNNLCIVCYNSGAGNDPDHLKLRIFKRSESSARQRSLEHNIELTDITLPSGCELCKEPIDYGFKSRTEALAPSINRLDSSKGYVKDNIEIWHHKCNRLWGQMTPDLAKRAIELYQERGLWPANESISQSMIVFSPPTNDNSEPKSEGTMTSSSKPKRKLKLVGS